MRFDMILTVLQKEAFAVEPNFAMSVLEDIEASQKGENRPSVATEDEVTSSVHGNVGVIALDGVMYKKDLSSMCMSVLSYDQIISQIDAMENNDKVDTILFRVDTRGGSVAGVEELHLAIKNSNKKTVLFAENIVASAGMWAFASSCDNVYSAKSTILGSIGIIMGYSDKEDDGRVKYLTSENSENKVCDMKDASCVDRVQARLNTFRGMFVSTLMSKYDKTEEQITNDFDRGGVIFAEEAHKLGYVDGITSFKEVLSSLVKGDTLATMPPSGKIANSQNKDTSMDGKQYEEQLNALQEQLDGADARLEQGIAAANKKMVDIASTVISTGMAMGADSSVMIEALTKGSKDSAELHIHKSTDTKDTSASFNGDKKQEDDAKKDEDSSIAEMKKAAEMARG